MLQRILLTVVRLYRRGVSPFTPPACRFVPTCSRYAEEALVLHGPVRGSWLAIRRILRCHPLGGKGFDPVPSTAREPRPTARAGEGR